MFKRLKIEVKKIDDTPHPQYESVNTAVSEYLRKYGQGKIDQLPQDSRPEVTDDRSSDEMLDDDSKTNHMACDDLDVLFELELHRQEFEDAVMDVELTNKQRQVFEDVVKVLDDPNSTLEQKREAYAALDELKDKITRARKT